MKNFILIFAAVIFTQLTMNCQLLSAQQLEQKWANIYDYNQQNNGGFDIDYNEQVVVVGLLQNTIAAMGNDILVVRYAPDGTQDVAVYYENPGDDRPFCAGRPAGVCFFHAGEAVNRR